MARELGLNPRSLIKNIPSPNQQWKLPVKQWIHELYKKKSGKLMEKKHSTTQSPRRMYLPQRVLFRCTAPALRYPKYHRAEISMLHECKDLSWPSGLVILGEMKYYS